MSPSKITPKKIERAFKALIDSQPHDFPKKYEELKVPNKPGVYIIYTLHGKIAHIGSTEVLLNRLTSHLYGRTSFVRTSRHKSKMLRNGYYFRYRIISNDRKRLLLEHYAHGKLCPDHFEGL